MGMTRLFKDKLTNGGSATNNPVENVHQSDASENHLKRVHESEPQQQGQSHLHHQTDPSQDRISRLPDPYAPQFPKRLLTGKCPPLVPSEQSKHMLSHHEQSAELRQSLNLHEQAELRQSLNNH